MHAWWTVVKPNVMMIGGTVLQIKLPDYRMNFVVFCFIENVYRVVRFLVISCLK